MINWEDRLKRHIAKKFSEFSGEEVPIESIKTIQVHVDLDLRLMSVKDLAQLYAFAVMKEDYEDAESLKNEFAKRNYEVKLNLDEKNHCGSIDVNPISLPDTIVATVPLLIFPDGYMIDWDKEDELK